jgi:hypothetical protein
MPTCTMARCGHNGSDLLEADRLKAGGFKPGTWALNGPYLPQVGSAGFRYTMGSRTDAAGLMPYDLPIDDVVN